jgi:hypothetical protein
VQPCDEDEEKDDHFSSILQVMEHRWNEVDKGKPKYSGEKPVPVPLCPPQITHGLTRDRIRASAVGMDSVSTERNLLLTLAASASSNFDDI